MQAPNNASIEASSTMNTPEALAAATAVAARVQAFTIAQLEAEYPWMAKVEIKNMADSMATSLQAGIAKQQPIMEASKSRVSFLSLSAELRNTIYEMALSNDSDDNAGTITIQSAIKNSGGFQLTSPLHFRSCRSRCPFRHPSPSIGQVAKSSPALLQTSHQIRHETKQLFLASSTFITKIHNPASHIPNNDAKITRDWLQNVVSGDGKWIKNFVIEFPETRLHVLLRLASEVARGPIPSDQNDVAYWNTGNTTARPVVDWIMEYLGLSKFGLSSSAVKIKYEGEPVHDDFGIKETLSPTLMFCGKCARSAEANSGWFENGVCAHCRDCEEERRKRIWSAGGLYGGAYESPRGMGPIFRCAW